MKSFLLGALGALFVLIAAAIIIPQYSDYMAQAETLKWFDEIKDTQNKITSRILNSGTVKNSGVSVDIPQSLNHLQHTRITDDGIIFLKGGSAGKFITLTPILVNEKTVLWQSLMVSLRTLIYTLKNQSGVGKESLMS